MVSKSKLADESIIEKGFLPTTTTERVDAYKNAMKSYWADAEKAR